MGVAEAPDTLSEETGDGDSGLGVNTGGPGLSGIGVATLRSAGESGCRFISYFTESRIVIVMMSKEVSSAHGYPHHLHV